MAAYIALLRKDGRSDYSVEFPDLPGCITAGRTLEEAREFAREALTLHLKGLAEDGAAIPAPSGLDAVMANPENRAKDTVAFLVDAPVRKARAVPVTITVAEDLFETVKAKSAEWGLTQSGVFSEGARMFIGKKLGWPSATRRIMKKDQKSGSPAKADSRSARRNRFSPASVSGKADAKSRS